MFYWYTLLAIYLSICLFAALLQLDKFQQFALQKELIIAPLVKWFPPATMRKHYWEILFAL